MQNQYYLAMLEGPTNDPSRCLLDHGFTEDYANLLIGNSSIQQSEAIVAPLGTSNALLIRKSAEGWQCWWAITGDMFGSVGEASEFADELNEQMSRADGTGRTWAVFQWRREPALHTMH